MAQVMLHISDLYVSVDSKQILRGLSLDVTAGTIHAIMGPNGSGKSTLAYVLAGHPRYTVVSGCVEFLGEDLLSLSVDERAKKGLFLSFQYPQEISGVPLDSFLRQAQREIAGVRGEKALSLAQFKRVLAVELKKLGRKEDMRTRYLNEGFSGGEKKRNEILQMALLKPKLVILDEVDSGLDVDALKSVAYRVKEYVNSDSSVSVLVVTHYSRILQYLIPHCVSIVVDGRVVEHGGRELSAYIEEKGYQSFL